MDSVIHRLSINKTRNAFPSLSLSPRPNFPQIINVLLYHRPISLYRKSVLVSFRSASS